MSGLEVAAGGIAVASVAIQVVDSIDKLDRFWGSVIDAPEDIRDVQDHLTSLRVVLLSIADAYKGSSFPSRDASATAERALDLCRRKVQSLCDIVDPLQDAISAGGRKRRWTMLKCALRKQVIAETLQRLEQAKSTLILTNQWVFYQVHQREMESVVDAVSNLAISSASSLQAVAKQISTVSQEGRPVLSPANLVVKHDSSAQVASSLRMRTFPNTSNGHLRVQKRIIEHFSQRFGSVAYRLVVTRHCHGDGDGDGRTTQISSDDDDDLEYQKTFIFFVPFLRRGLAMQTTTRSYGHWTRTLRFSPVVSADAPIFQFCRSGNVEGVRTLFKSGLASPFDATMNGYTPLHEAAAHGQSDVCKLLVNLGADASAVATREFDVDARVTPLLSLARASYLFGESLGDEILDIVRALVQTGQGDPMAETQHGATFFHVYGGPAAVYHWMLHQDYFPVDLSHSTVRGVNALTVQAANKEFSSPDLLKFLLDAGADPKTDVDQQTPLHYAVQRRSIPDWVFPDTFNLDNDSCSECRVALKSKGFMGISGLDLYAISQKRRCGPVSSRTLLSYHGRGMRTCPRIKGFQDNWCRYIKLLIESGCDVHAQVPLTDWTPLGLLVRYGHMQELRLWLKTLRELQLNMHEYGRKEQALHPAGYILAHCGLFNSRRCMLHMRRVRFHYGKTTADLTVTAETFINWMRLFELLPFSLDEFFAFRDTTTSPVHVPDPALLDAEQRAHEISQILHSWVLTCLRAKNMMWRLVHQCRMGLQVVFGCLVLYIATRWLARGGQKK